MKIGILTFHRSINYGAFMQAYSLSNRLKKEFPDDIVEIIDYSTETVQDKYSDSWEKRLRRTETVKGKCRIIADVFLDNGKMRRQAILNKAFEANYQFFPLSKEQLVSDDIDVANSWLKGRYDIIIVGSDCVWETFGYPFPNLYFLNDVNNVVKMSYAASLARLYYPTLGNEKRKYMREALGKFCYRGIRDVSTEMFLDNCGYDYCHNCDPTLLLDLDSIQVDMSRIENRFVEAGILPSDKVIGIMGGNTMCNMVRKAFGKKYKIVSLYTKCKASDLFIGDLTPLEWAKVFSMFSVTVTNYFHGSLLSMVNGTPPIAIDIWNECGPGVLTKIDDLYTRLKLKEHYFKGNMLRSEKGKKELCLAIEHFIYFPNTDKIATAVAKEKESFGSFLSALNTVRNRLADE